MCDGAATDAASDRTVEDAAAAADRGLPSAALGAGLLCGGGGARELRT